MLANGLRKMVEPSSCCVGTMFDASCMVCGMDSEESPARGIRASQSLWPERRDGLLLALVDLEEGREDVLNVYSEMKDGMSLSAPPDSVVLVLWDAIVYKS